MDTGLQENQKELRKELNNISKTPQTDQFMLSLVLTRQSMEEQKNN